MNDFVKEHQVDMIAMISQEHDLLERIFVKSNIKEMMLQSQVPLIILPGKGNMKYMQEGCEKQVTL